MTVREVANPGDIRGSVSEAEWEARVDLAAAYRLVAHAHGSDLTYNHITVRVPDEPDHMLIKPFDEMFEEVTASSLVKYDFEGNPADGNGRPLFGGGKVIHGGVYQARSDVNAAFHTHTPAVMGICSQKQGLLPINQYSISLWHDLAYHPFHGFEFNVELRDPLFADMGDKNIVLMHNHGALVCGASVGAAFVSHHFLDLACQGQLAAMTGGAELIRPDPEKLEYALAQIKERQAELPPEDKDWAACLRMAHRVAPGFDT